MFERPPDLADATVHACVATGWGIDVADCVWSAIGFGGHHWWVTDPAGARWFVSVFDLEKYTTAGLDRAFAGAQRLVANGLAGAVVPHVTLDGCPGLVLGTRWYVTVQPEVEGREIVASDALLAKLADDDACAVARTVAAMHALDAGPLDLWAPVLTHGERISAALARDPQWGPGPFADAAEGAWLQGRDMLAAALAEYEPLAARIAEAPLVPTHGEVSAHNVVVAEAGPVLIDWETLRAGPIERDLVGLVRAEGALDAYLDAGGREPDAGFLRFFALDWPLAEVVWGIGRFAKAHEDTPDNRVVLGQFTRAIASLTR